MARSTFQIDLDRAKKMYLLLLTRASNRTSSVALIRGRGYRRARGGRPPGANDLNSISAHARFTARASNCVRQERRRRGSRRISTRSRSLSRFHARSPVHHRNHHQALVFFRLKLLIGVTSPYLSRKYPSNS